MAEFRRPCLTHAATSSSWSSWSPLVFWADCLFMHVDHSGFYEIDSGIKTGIYSFFRGGLALAGTIPKPTGSKQQVVNLINSYSVVWRPYSMSARYWLQAVPTTTSRALHPQTDLKTASGGTGTRNGRHE